MPAEAPSLQRIVVSQDGRHFVGERTGQRVVIWGVNYDHDHEGRLLEDYWYDQWPIVVEDFHEIKALGANAVRVHLQVGRFMIGPDAVNERAIQQLARLVKLAERIGLYLDITGLGCYHKADVPAWYDTLSEHDRWEVQATFWQAVAGVCADSPTIFCYDLMNEPILPGRNKVETDWLAGEFGGKHFVQRISLDLAGRTRQQVAGAWVNRLTKAIRSRDKRHMITVGVIPWVMTFPGARPLFYDDAVGAGLDFVSIHVYPRKGELDSALNAVKVFDLGKPLVIEECAPLYCGREAFDRFVDASRDRADGYFGFYWGRTLAECRADNTLRSGIMADWLDYFQTKSPQMIPAEDSR
ncbi:glycoside hydrolase family 5 protein [Planctomycetales bacterium ZRK34]|nr:glycoside hydrolase family 5 protein [Planctomycetales bacterium ZRK34]